jgi:D-glycero-D-manno-heptose 1,7-bisphosphate phosphatase
VTVDAVFLDRDGVINCERRDYVKSRQEFELLPGVLDALAILADLIHPVLVISNQSAVGRGLLTMDILNEIHSELRRSVETHGGRIDAFYVCPHHPDDGCSCRKPQPGLLLQAARDFELDLGNCIFVGDSVTDYQAASAAGCRSVMVRTGRQGQELDHTVGDAYGVPIVRDLLEAVNFIVSEDLRDQRLG